MHLSIGRSVFMHLDAGTLFSCVRQYTPIAFLGRKVAKSVTVACRLWAFSSEVTIPFLFFFFSSFSLVFGFFLCRRLVDKIRVRENRCRLFLQKY